MSQRVVPSRTLLGALTTYAALQTQWRTQVGTEPTRPQLLTMLAQVWHETGQGRSCYNWNLGGIKSARVGGEWYDITTTEGSGSVARTVVASFRAYANLDDSAADYVHLLRSTFGGTWPAIEAADVADYAHRLKIRGYYTDSEANYAAGLARNYAALAAVIPDEPQPVEVARQIPDFLPPEPPDGVA